MLKCNHNFIVRLINYLHLRHYKNTLDCDFTTQIAEMGLYLKVLFTKTAFVQLVLWLCDWHVTLLPQIALILYMCYDYQRYQRSWKINYTYLKFHESHHTYLNFMKRYRTTQKFINGIPCMYEKLLNRL